MKPLLLALRRASGMRDLFWQEGFYAAAQRGPGWGENIRSWLGATVAGPDAARCDVHFRRDFQQLQPNGIALGFRPLPVRQAQPPQGLDKHIGQRGEVQPQLIGPQRLRARPVREQAQLLLDAILDLAGRTAELFIAHARNVRLIAENRLRKAPAMSPQNENVRFVQSRNVRSHGWPRGLWKRSGSP
jgi:hypothetical protein